jgi:hypothetical protein
LSKGDAIYAVFWSQFMPLSGYAPEMIGKIYLHIAIVMGIKDAASRLGFVTSVEHSYTKG